MSLSTPGNQAGQVQPRGERASIGRILVVEDEGIVAYDIVDALRAMGYSVVATAASGEQAIENARDLRPDLVLMDIRLADAMDGIEAAERIQSDRDIPIVYLTAHSDEKTLRRMSRRAMPGTGLGATPRKCSSNA